MEILRKIGVFLSIIGIVSVVLYTFDYSLRIIAWLDDYQPVAGAVIGVVGVLIVLGTYLAAKPAQPQPQQPVPPQG